MNALEKAEVERLFLLGNAPMRAQPTAQQRPKTFHGIHMYFTKAVAIFISGIFAPAMIDTLMCIAPSLKTGINAVLIRVNQGSWLDGVFDERLSPAGLSQGRRREGMRWEARRARWARTDVRVWR